MAASTRNFHPNLETWAKSFPLEEADARIHQLERELARLRSWRDTFIKAADSGPAGMPTSRPAAIRRVLREGGNEPALPAEIDRKSVV